MDHPPYSTDLARNDFSVFPQIKRKMHGQRFSSPEDIIGVFKTHVLEVSQSEWKTNTNDGRASKHTEYRYAKKCQTSLWKCQISAGSTRNMLDQQFV